MAAGRGRADLLGSWSWGSVGLVSSRREGVLSSRREGVLSSRRVGVLSSRREGILRSKKEGILSSRMEGGLHFHLVSSRVECRLGEPLCRESWLSSSSSRSRSRAIW